MFVYKTDSRVKGQGEGQGRGRGASFTLTSLCCFSLAFAMAAMARDHLGRATRGWGHRLPPPPL